ncbi:MAG TPA: radical SAM protein [Bacteroidales bacterium]|nr:radical SAM protein [Bacteroidales bacterium]HRZ50251.1 radical SAM protein [Bacteroidales bacterium]
MKHLLYGIKYIADYWFKGGKRPLICGLVLHNACNLRCRHCTVIDRQKARMTFDEVKQVTDQFYADGGRCLYLEGGEPFLWSDGAHTMEHVVQYAHKKGYFTVIIYTNGTMPLQSEADTIFVSVDGLKSSHDKIRGTSFDRIMENIRKSDHPSIYINYTINTENKSDLAGFCAYIDKIPQIRGVFFYFHTPYYGYDELYIDFPKRKEIMSEIILLKRRYRVLNSRTGLRSAIRDDWKRNLRICRVYEQGVYYDCCRESKNKSLCQDCGYLSYAEINQCLKLRPGAVLNALKYF